MNSLNVCQPWAAILKHFLLPQADTGSSPGTIWGSENVILSEVCFFINVISYFLTNERGNSGNQRGKEQERKETWNHQTCGRFNAVLLGREAPVRSPSNPGWSGKMQSLRPAWTISNTKWNRPDNVTQHRLSHWFYSVPRVSIPSPTKTNIQNQPSPQPTGGFKSLQSAGREPLLKWKLFMYPVSSVNCGSWASTLKVSVLTTTSHPSASNSNSNPGFSGLCTYKLEDVLPVKICTAFLGPFMSWLEENWKRSQTSEGGAGVTDHPPQFQCSGVD